MNIRDKETLKARVAPYEKTESLDVESFRFVPQEGLVHKLFPEDVKHNAMWDFAVLDDGRVFFPLCAELGEALYVRLYEYLPATNEFHLHFRLEDRIIQQDREIRTSKIHTSINKMNDGRIIMTTHTTARSPCHPQWMPEAYYNHPWEGYQGSVILIYDPESGFLENRGVAVPRESIYGAAYDRRHNALFFQGYLRGHLYRFDIEANQVKDMGKVTEYGSFRLHVGPDGHIYSNSRSGEFFRVNVDTMEIEHIAVFPEDWGELSLGYRQLNYAANGPDGCIYLGVYFCQQLLRYNPQNGELEQLGDFRVPEFQSWGTETMNGMTFDNEGILWYGLQLNTYPQDIHGTRLCSWDVVRGGRPVDYGLLGSAETGRALAVITELHYSDRKLYMSDSNHGYDAPGIMVVDVDALMEQHASGVKGPISPDAFSYNQAKTDAAIYPGEEYYQKVLPYVQVWEDYAERARFLKENHDELTARSIDMIRLWREIGFEASPVRALRWKDNDTLVAESGGQAEKHRLEIQGRTIVKQQTIQDFSPIEPMPPALQGYSYPSVPGRQYLAVPTAWCRWRDGCTLVGTKDGMLAVVGENKVYSLGLCAPNGPVRMLSTNESLDAVYGVAGDDMDLGTVFRYTGDNGLEWLGRVHFNKYAYPGILSSNILSCCALSPDGKKLAIGAADRMGMVYVYHL